MAKVEKFPPQASIDRGTAFARGGLRGGDCQSDRDSARRRQTVWREYPSTIFRSAPGEISNSGPRTKTLPDSIRPDPRFQNNPDSSPPALRLRARAANDENRHSTLHRILSRLPQPHLPLENRFDCFPEINKLRGRALVLSRELPRGVPPEMFVRKDRRLRE